MNTFPRLPYKIPTLLCSAIEVVIEHRRNVETGVERVVVEGRIPHCNARIPRREADKCGKTEKEAKLNRMEEEAERKECEAETRVKKVVAEVPRTINDETWHKNKGRGEARKKAGEGETRVEKAVNVVQIRLNNAQITKQKDEECGKKNKVAAGTAEEA